MLEINETIYDYFLSQNNAPEGAYWFYDTGTEKFIGLEITKSDKCVEEFDTKFGLKMWLDEGYSTQAAGDISFRKQKFIEKLSDITERFGMSIKEGTVSIDSYIEEYKIHYDEGYHVSIAE